MTAISNPSLFIPIQCRNCRFLLFKPDQKIARCEAFPDGIPQKMYNLSHLSPVEGDHGIQYTSIDYATNIDEDLFQYQNEEYVEPIKENSNDCHEEAGSPKGGQFCSEGSGEASSQKTNIVYADDIEGMADGLDSYKKSGKIKFFDMGNGVIATVSGKEAGFAAEGEMGIELTVAKEFQKQGIGKLLINEYTALYSDEELKDNVVHISDYNPKTEPILFQKNLDVSNNAIKENPTAAENGLNEWIYRSGSVRLQYSMSTDML